MGSILEVIPLQDDDPVFDFLYTKSLPIVFDAITHSSFARNSEHHAAQFAHIVNLSPKYKQGYNKEKEAFCSIPVDDWQAKELANMNSH